jgi:hypothetical protein
MYVGFTLRRWSRKWEIPNSRCAYLLCRIYPKLGNKCGKYGWYFIYILEWLMAFTTQFSLNAQSHNVQIFYTKFHPNLVKKYERYSLFPFSEAWLADPTVAKRMLAQQRFVINFYTSLREDPTNCWVSESNGGTDGQSLNISVFFKFS